MATLPKFPNRLTADAMVRRATNYLSASSTSRPVRSSRNPQSGQVGQGTKNTRQSAVAHQRAGVLDIGRQESVLRHGRDVLAQQRMRLFQCGRALQRAQELQP